MRYVLNSTADYHRNELTSLGWELTVCNCLEPAESPCRKALRKPLSFGQNLYHFLAGILPLNDVQSVVEIGGGMGYLMRDFLSLHPPVRARMIDIAPYLLQRQKETLQSFPVDFQLADVCDMPVEELAGFDLAILNENLGDLPTLLVQPEAAGSPEEDAPECIERLHHFSRNYGLPLKNDMQINIGAMEVVEKLCQAQIRYIYLSEHSCEASVPEAMKPYLSFSSDGYPEGISLKGHREFTVKFSYLQKIAKMLNYETRRGAFADFLALEFNDRIKTALRLASPVNDEQEIIRQFVYDLYKYEYLILMKGDDR